MNILNRFGRTLRDAYDILVPPGCPICQRTMAISRICNLCLPRPLISATENPCLLCGEPLVRSKTLLLCPGCSLKPLSLYWIRALYLYDGLFRRILHRIKYDGCSQLLEQVLQGNSINWAEILPRTPPRLIVPVPANQTTYARRGFDQALLIARIIKERANWRCPIAPAILKTTRTSIPQSHTARSKRMANSKGLYRCNTSLSGLDVLLIDDLWTTGATIHSAAQALKASGARHVAVITLARAPDWDRAYR